MSNASASLIRRPASGLRGQDGYTLISLVISMFISAVVLTGAWLAYENMQSEMHVLNADRQMDQYAQSAFQELTNVCSWSWAGVQVQGGSQHTRWKFLMQDIPQEFGTHMHYQTDQDGFVVLRYTPTQGILINDRPPTWAEDRYHDFYVFTGRSPRAGEIRAFDRRDRMTIEGLTMDYAQTQFIPTTDPIGQISAKGTVMVNMTLQYRYRANAMFGLYSKDYVHERTYATQIYMRNWDSDVNDFRKTWIQSLIGMGNGGPS